MYGKKASSPSQAERRVKATSRASQTSANEHRTYNVVDCLWFHRDGLVFFAVTCLPNEAKERLLR